MLASVLPSGLKTSDDVDTSGHSFEPARSFSTATSLKVAVSQRRTVWSQLADARNLPSGLNATE